jgi:hypothetical protein
MINTGLAQLETILKNVQFCAHPDGKGTLVQLASIAHSITLLR